MVAPNWRDQTNREIARRRGKVGGWVLARRGGEEGGGEGHFILPLSVQPPFSGFELSFRLEHLLAPGAHVRRLRDLLSCPLLGESY